MYVYKGRESPDCLSVHQCDSLDFQPFPHVHSEMELVYLRSGTVTALVDGDRVTAGAGDCILILPHQIHCYESVQDAETYSVSFSMKLLPVFQAQLGNNVTDRNVFPLDEIASLCFRHYFIEQHRQSVFEQVTALYSVCNCLMKTASIVPRKYPEHAPAYRVIQYISEHYLEEISMQTAAEALGYEYHYLSKMFNQTTHSGFRAFLNYHRIEYARTMLQNTRDPITRIAMNAGFRCIRSFNRAFLEITGVTPRDYRNRLEQGH